MATPDSRHHPPARVPRGRRGHRSAQPARVVGARDSVSRNARLARWPGPARSPHLGQPHATAVLDPNMVDHTLAIIDSTGLALDHVQLEITEGSIFHHTESTLGVLHSLRECGIRIAIDDFRDRLCLARQPPPLSTRHPQDGPRLLASSEPPEAATHSSTASSPSLTPSKSRSSQKASNARKSATPCGAWAVTRLRVSSSENRSLSQHGNGPGSPLRFTGAYDTVARERDGALRRNGLPTPSESGSLIIQATIGCPHNLCAFCGMYGDKRFRARPTREVVEDLDSAFETCGPSVRTLFLADGNCAALPTRALIEITHAAHERFPQPRTHRRLQLGQVPGQKSLADGRAGDRRRRYHADPARASKAEQGNTLGDLQRGDPGAGGGGLSYHIVEAGLDLRST